jgi:sugar porter (SP) family MFS transporter
MNKAQIGFVSSIFTLGGFIGAVVAGPVAARYGRLRAMQYTTPSFILGPIFEALAPSIPVMAIGRFFSGLGAGAAVVIVPIYIAEIAPPAEKGFFGAFTQIGTNVGIFTTQLLGYFLSHDQMWRIILAIGGAVGVVQAVGLLLSVESPRWLVEQGYPRDAKIILRKVRGDGIDIDEEMASWGLEHREGLEDEEETLLPNEGRRMSQHSITLNKKHDAKETVGMLEVIKHPDYNKAVFAVIMIMVCQQFTGINSIIFYGVGLLADLLQSNSALLNLAVSALGIVATIAFAPLVDRLGRKTCLLSSITGMGISAFLLGIGILRSVPILSAVAVLLFVGSYALGLGPIPFILASELVGPEAVGATQGWGLGVNWIATFIVAQFFPMINAALGKGKIYFIFTGIAAFFVVFIGWFVPETKVSRNAPCASTANTNRTLSGQKRRR